MRDYLSDIRERVVVFDGGMGATLEQFDLGPGDYGGLQGKCHEALVLHRPDVIAGVHTSMVEAGADVVETDTFQGSRLKLEEWGLGDRVGEINRRAAEIAREAVGAERFVAGSMGPTGYLPSSTDPSLGDISFGELRGVFAEQAEALLRGGVDLLLIETAQDILEAKAAVLGAREAIGTTGRSVPIEVSVSLLAENGKMLLGTDIEAVLTTLTALKVDALGLNCSTGPEDMRDAIRFLGRNSPVPVHCMPNAGIPRQGPDGETVFPEGPRALAEVLAEYVEEYSVSIVGGCCGTTPDHIRAIAERVKGRRVDGRPEDSWRGYVASMMSATRLKQEPAPTLVGERVNAQGSRRVKQLLIDDDYDGLVEIAETQVGAGAHMVDVCTALTERADEAAQMAALVKEISLRVDVPIQVDSTEPETVEAALERIPGRAVVNSVNLEAGRAKLDLTAEICVRHGAGVVALTIDEAGMAKSAERKLEVAGRIYGYLCDEHGLEPEAVIFDVLTFALTTGEDEWKGSALETINGIALVKRELPGVLTSLGISNVSFGIAPHARAVLNSVFLHHAVEAGLDLAMVNPAEIVPYAEIPEVERALADDLILGRRDDALERYVEHFEGRPAEEAEPDVDPTDGMDAADALRWHVLHRKKDGVEDRVDAAVSTYGAAQTLNQVLLPAMKEVGDKFGSGDLILPFVLQSAEVMKRAVTRLERYLDKIEGHTKGTVVLATVFGDVHDIGKSLVKTILSNNGFTVVDLGKQVPVNQIVDAAVEHDATAIGLSALLVSTSKQMPICVAELHRRDLMFPVLIGGAAIDRDFGRRIAFPKGLESDEFYEPGVFYCKDAFQGLGRMEDLADEHKRRRLIAQTRDTALEFRRSGRVRESLDTSDASVRSGVVRDNPVPVPPYWGAREVPVEMHGVFELLDTRVLFKLHWGGKGVKGKAWEALVERDFRPRLERMWTEAAYLEPRALVGYFPVASAGNELIVFDPEDQDIELARFGFPRQPANARLCLADYWRPVESGERDVAVLQAVTVGPKATELSADLERRGEFAEQLFVHGLAVQTAEGIAEWAHAKVRSDMGLPPDQGRRYSWGYPACPDQSGHETVFRLLGADRIGLSLSSAFAVEPEQSTVAIVTHHPQAVYFGMRSGSVPSPVVE